MIFHFPVPSASSTSHLYSLGVYSALHIYLNTSFHFLIVEYILSSFKTQFYLSCLSPRNVPIMGILHILSRILYKNSCHNHTPKCLNTKNKQHCKFGRHVHFWPCWKSADFIDLTVMEGYSLQHYSHCRDWISIQYLLPSIFMARSWNYPKTNSVKQFLYIMRLMLFL